MIRLILAFGCAISVAACGTVNYSHPNKTQAQYEADMYDCDQMASAKTRNDGFGNNPLIAGQNIRDCMVRKYGYSIGGGSAKPASTPVCRRDDGSWIKGVPGCP